MGTTDRPTRGAPGAPPAAMNMGRADVTAAKLDVHTRDSQFVSFMGELSLRNPEVADQRKAGPKKLLENDAVQNLLAEATHEMAITQQRVDLSRAEDHSMR